MVILSDAEVSDLQRCEDTFGLHIKGLDLLGLAIVWHRLFMALSVEALSTI